MFTVYYSNEDQYNQISAETLSRYWFHYDEMIDDGYPGAWCRRLSDDTEEDSINLILDLDNGDSAIQIVNVREDGIVEEVAFETFGNWHEGLAMYDFYAAKLGIRY